eukprot:6412474-Alexandrium_andersonii.AAC.1
MSKCDAALAGLVPPGIHPKLRRLGLLLAPALLFVADRPKRLPVPHTRLRCDGSGTAQWGHSGLDEAR